MNPKPESGMDIDGDGQFEPLEQMEIRVFPKAGRSPSLWRLFQHRSTGERRWFHIPDASVRHMSASLVYQDEVR